MKLNARDARAYFSKPDPTKAGLLIYGPDAMRIATRRKDVLMALVGKSAEEEMRLTRLNSADVRKDPAALLDAVKAQGFFPGPRAALVDDATDTLTKTITAALEDWKDGDAQIVVTAGQLTPRSSLRKLFEGHRNALAAPVYADPPTRDEIEAELKTAGIRDIASEALSDLLELGRALEPGDFRQTVEKLALYTLKQETPVSSEDVAACAPVSSEAALDDALDIVAEGRSQEIGPILTRLEAQGIAPVRLCIGATLHFRRLYTAACDPRGPEAGMFGVPFSRKDKLVRQSKTWGAARLEQALQLLTDTDLQLRSSKPTPDMALVERAMIRLSMMNRR